MLPRPPSVWEQLARRDPRRVVFSRTVPPGLVPHVGPPPFVRRVSRGVSWPPTAPMPALPAPPDDADDSVAD